MIPIAFCISNAFEWWIHRYVMHRPVKGFMGIYKRHTLAHLLAAAVLERYPHAKPTIGPAVDTGFYYDFDFSGGDAPKEADLAALEGVMRELLPSWETMTGTEGHVLEALPLDRLRALLDGRPDLLIVAPAEAGAQDE